MVNAEIRNGYLREKEKEKSEEKTWGRGWLFMYVPVIKVEN